MDLKEEIDKRLDSGFSKKEITTFLMTKGFTKADIQKNFPKIKRNSALYLFILIWSTILSLGLLVSNIFFASLLSLGGLIVILLCVGTFLLFKMNKIGFIIHMAFYAFFIILWFLGFLYYQGEGPDLINFSLWSFVVVFTICSFLIRSHYRLFNKC